MAQNETSFSYTYSAKQQGEIKRICQEYIPPEENKLEVLHRLDVNATRPDKIVSIAMGPSAPWRWGVACAVPWSGRTIFSPAF